MVDHTQDSIGNEPAALSIPLPVAAHQLADEFATQQPTPEQSDRVRRNTLAVWAVNQYLTLLGVTTDLSAGDSWNPILRSGEDVADLVLPNLGRLECRILLPHETEVALPKEVRTDRIGYVAVELETDLKRAWILGFIPSLDVMNPATVLHRSKLRPRDELIDHLFRLEVLPRLLSEAEVTLPAEVKTEVVAQLERVFLQEKEVLRGIKGEKAMEMVIDRQQAPESNGMVLINSTRETGLPGDRRQRQKLIQDVLRKLAQVCEEEL